MGGEGEGEGLRMTCIACIRTGILVLRWMEGMHTNIQRKDQKRSDKTRKTCLLFFFFCYRASENLCMVDGQRERGGKGGMAYIHTYITNISAALYIDQTEFQLH